MSAPPTSEATGPGQCASRTNSWLFLDTNATLAFMGEPARNLADERLAAILALPLSEEPETDEERAIFEQAEADMRAGVKGYTSEEILETIAQMRCDQGE